jgi:hypothetical protein
VWNQGVRLPCCPPDTNCCDESCHEVDNAFGSDNTASSAGHRTGYSQNDSRMAKKGNSYNYNEADIGDWVHNCEIKRYFQHNN